MNRARPLAKPTRLGAIALEALGWIALGLLATFLLAWIEAGR